MTAYVISVLSMAGIYAILRYELRLDVRLRRHVLDRARGVLRHARPRRRLVMLGLGVPSVAALLIGESWPVWWRSSWRCRPGGWKATTSS